ncbi:MAG: nuclear transport factor 2 family protein [Bryobacteraceae bacterium]|jgi:ketosteroid isomerase-like protein
MRNANLGIVVALVMVSAGQTSLSGQTATEGMRQRIIAKEQEGLNDLKTGDLAAFSSSLAEDAVFVDAHGPASKAEVVEHTAGFRIQEYTMEDVRFVQLSSTSGLIAYTLTEKGTSHGRDFAAKVYVSALWAERGDKWVCVFSQETAAK